VDPALKDKVAEELRATSSQLPLQITDPVLSYINFFSTGRGRRILTYGVQRSGRYKALIRRVLDEEGVPQELIYLAQAESGFQPRAVSRKRATGMWQFMQARGRQYGLEQSPYFDDRLDPEKATRAAARHLRDLYHHFGDWYLAMAAYDCGPVNVDRGVERTGYADFWELRNRNVLPKETANYVPAILAMTIVMKNAKEYGLDGIDGDPPLEHDTIDIAALTHLQLVADLAECPVSQLHDLNPALLKNIAPAGRPLQVPRGSGAALAAVLETVPPEKRTAWRVHRVVGGETLGLIAQRYRVTQNSILAANRPGASALEAGDLLIIPALPVREKPAVKRAVHRHGAPAHAASATHSASAKRTRPATYTAANIHPRGTAKPATAKQ
jgi:membrane-bound lytic murein transglycosylase D